MLRFTRNRNVTASAVAERSCTQGSHRYGVPWSSSWETIRKMIMMMVMMMIMVMIVMMMMMMMTTTTTTTMMMMTMMYGSLTGPCSPNLPGLFCNVIGQEF